MKLKELYLYSGVTIINGAEESFGSAQSFVDTLSSVLSKSRFSNTTEFEYFTDADENILDLLDDLTEENPDIPDFIVPMVLDDEDNMNKIIDLINGYIDENRYFVHYYILIITEDVTAGERERHIDISELRERFDLYLNV